MNAPYTPGNEVTWLTPTYDGITVQSATVVTVIHTGPDLWSVSTTLGTTYANADGEGPQIAPLTEEISAQLNKSGGLFTVHPTNREV